MGRVFMGSPLFFVTRFMIRPMADITTPGSPTVSEVEAEAKELYRKFISNDPLLHCNRFPSWRDLRDYQKATWYAKAKEVLGKG